MVEDLIFDKFMRHEEKFEEQFYAIENIKQMDELIEWIFT